MATGRLTELRHDLGRENTRGESSPENGRELFVQTANAHLVEVPVRVDYRLDGSFAGTRGHTYIHHKSMRTVRTTNPEIGAVASLFG